MPFFLIKAPFGKKLAPIVDEDRFVADKLVGK
jgi:hypothetical protein